MDTFKIILFASFFALTTFGCVKDKFEEDIKDSIESSESSKENNSFLNMEISDDFHFKTSNVETINFADKNDGEGKLTIYGLDKHDNSQLLGSYTVKKGTSINLEIPAHIIFLNGILHRMDGTLSSSKIELSETSTFSFGKHASPQGRLSSESSCLSGDVTVTQTGGTITIPHNKTYVIPEGHTFSGNVRFNKNGLLRVCGTANVSNIYENYNQSNIIITSNGSWNSTNKLILEEANSNFTNYGTVTANSFQAQGKYYNHGTTTISGGVTLDLKANVYNHSTMTVGGNYNINQGGNLHNYCTTDISNNLTNHGKLYNYGRIDVGNKIHFKHGATHSLGNGSLTTGGSTDIYGIVQGPTSGDYARLNISGTTRMYWEGRIRYNVDFCDANGIEMSNSSSLAASVVSCVTTITGQSGCFEGTEGSAPEENSTQYYPGEDVFGSYVYEDLWPSYGDFDFNDLVMDYNYQFDLNSSNKITSITAKFKIRAIGAAYNNGFAIQLPVSSSSVTSVVGNEIVGGIVTIGGNGVEEGQSNAVIVIYDKINDYAGGGSINVVPGFNTKDIPMSTVVISFDTPVDLFSATDMNPFIYVNQVRGHEVHLSDKSGTDKMDSSLYGSSDSKSNAEPFKSSSNLPFSFALPVSFEYPIERQIITNAYLKFSSWAQSSGNADGTWYTSESGNRNANKVY